MILHVLYVRLILCLCLAACAAPHVAASFFDFFRSTATVDTLDSAIVQHRDSNAIRGVLESSHARYADPFLCDGRRQLLSGAVNDGFCDCADGTDEPGKEARYIALVVLMFYFHCLPLHNVPLLF
jgi:hypothetical protein